MIDPGHGGRESGATAKIKKGKRWVTVYEKNLTLKLAKKLKKILDKEYNVYLTRSHDKTLSLLERAKMADTVKADLFISIHFNSTRNHHAAGIETFYLDNHRNKAVRKVESVENASIKGNEKVVNKILIDLAIHLTSSSSKKLAHIVHKNIVKKVNRRFSIKNRKYKPGMFFVLALSKRPGILIEAGFMSNKAELKKIVYTDYLHHFAAALAQGVYQYAKTEGKIRRPTEVLSMGPRREREREREKQ